jgi:hypothetical protein
LVSPFEPRRTLGPGCRGCSRGLSLHGHGDATTVQPASVSSDHIIARNNAYPAMAHATIAARVKTRRTHVAKRPAACIGFGSKSTMGLRRVVNQALKGDSGYALQIASQGFRWLKSALVFRAQASASASHSQRSVRPEPCSGMNSSSRTHRRSPFSKSPLCVTETMRPSLPRQEVRPDTFDSSSTCKCYRYGGRTLHEFSRLALTR